MITAIVTPNAKSPTVGTEITPQSFLDVGTPSVRVPTDGIRIESGETIYVDGAIVVNGTMSGSGVPSGGSGSGGATALNGLNDVTLSSLSSGQVLKWSGSQWVNDTDGGLTSINLAQLQDVNLTNLADGSTLQYNNPNGKWEAVTETDFVDSIIDGGVANSTYVAVLDLDGGSA